jgi:hypothetical protein
MKALEIATSAQTPWQDFKAGDGWPKRVMYPTGIGLCRRTMLAQKLPTDITK